MGVHVLRRGNRLSVIGDKGAREQAAAVLRSLYARLEQGRSVAAGDIDGAMRMGPGTLYGTLQRLMEQGLVEEASGPARPIDERRRYYQLTKSGRAALKGEVERMETLVRTARARRVAARPSRG